MILIVFADCDPKHQLYLKAVVLTVMFVVSAAKSCGFYEFPNLNKPLVTARENETVKIQFQLSTAECPSQGDTTIEIRKFSRGMFRDHCSIRQQKGYCLVPLHTTGCGCVSEKRDYYQMTKTVDRSDNTLWQWTSSNGMVEDKIITFNILYNAKIVQLDTLSHSHPDVTEHGAPLDIVCSWENGNPPVRARLLDRHGVAMKTTPYTTGQIQYTFPAVGCQDSGLIRCEAPGAIENKTLPILVRCKPEFNETAVETNISVSVGQPLEMEFPVRSYNINTTVCNITQLSSATHDAQFELGDSYIPPLPDNGTNLSFCRVHGTPPDLTLTFRLDNVSREDEGQWRLELTNDVGTEHVQFYMHAIEWNFMSTSANTTVTSASSLTSATSASSAESVDIGNLITSNWKAVTAIGTFLVVITIVITVIVICKRRGGRHAKLPSIELEELNMDPVNIEERPASVYSHESHAYWEVEDVMPQLPDENMAEDNPPQGAAENMPEDYLHPLPGASENMPEDYLHPLAGASESYEIPVLPDYAVPNPVYESLRHIYDRLAGRFRRVLARN